MHRLGIILMGFVLLNAATEIHQLFRMPALWAHLRHHRQETPGMTLLEFLRLHYADAEHPNDGDEQEDESLPFRSVGTLQHIDLNWTPVPEQEMNRPLKPARQFFNYQEPLCSRIPSGVFHPPRKSA